MPPLSIDDDLVRWSVSAEERREALATRPLLVLLHGWGDDEAGIASLASQLPGGFVVAAPRAPLPMPGGEPGFGWFQPLHGPGSPSEEEATAAVDAVLDWLHRVAPAGPVVVGGFSQGGATTVQLFRTAPDRFAAGASFSGFIAPYSGDGDARLAQLRKPLFYGTDPEDPVFPVGAPARIEAFLTAHFDVETHHYPTIGHSISPREVADFAAFLEGLAL